MALTTAQDLLTLSSWNWLRDYSKNRQAFIDIGKIVYQSLTAYSPSYPSGPNVLEPPLTAALRVANIFRILCQSRPFARPSLYPCFASALARYILDNEWAEITHP